jgi:hypothetical protein
MLEVSSSRIDLSPSANLLTSCFLELYGETSPVVDPDYARVLAARGKATAGPIYEYFWTLGRCEPPPQDDAQQQDPRESRKASASGGRHWRFPHSHRTGDADGWGEFTTDSSAQVRLLFPRNSGWRAHELAVSVKYLAPVPQQKSFLEEMGKEIAALQPLLGVAGTVAGAAGEVGAGPVASATGQVLDAVAKMKVDSVPQAPGFEWSVEKITTWVERKPEDRMLPGADKELVDGVAWNLPQKMFEVLGSRINGSIAVSLVPLSNQDPAQMTSAHLLPGIVRVCAVLPLRPKPVRLPEDDYIYLQVHPVEPSPPNGNSRPRT